MEISYRNVRRLLRLMNEILDLWKVEARKLTLESSPFDLVAMMHDCAATMSPAFEQKGLLFEMTIEPDTWRYWVGDAERLQAEVLLNLIGNSIKFTARGSIIVEVAPQAGQPVPRVCALKSPIPVAACNWTKRTGSLRTSSRPGMP